MESDTHCNSSVVRFAPNFATQDSYIDIITLMGDGKVLLFALRIRVTNSIFVVRFCSPTEKWEECGSVLVLRWLQQITEVLFYMMYFDLLRTTAFLRFIIACVMKVPSFCSIFFLHIKSKPRAVSTATCFPCHYCSCVFFLTLHSRTLPAEQLEEI